MKIAGTIQSNQDKDGMLRRSLERIIQLYTDKSHFVYELLQNAEDAEATCIKFIQYDDRLEVYHNGKPFTTANLQGLCDIGKSDKINNLNQIGEFGVGFKSVFGICEVVQLYSNPSSYSGEIPVDAMPFAVEIQDFVRPEDIDDADLDEKYTTKFVFPYCVNQSFSGFKSISALKTAISKRLQDLGITTLLFMKSLEVIEYQINIDGKRKEGNYLLDKQVINEHCSVVSAFGESSTKNEEISYLKYTRSIDSNSRRTVDIAFSFKTNGDGVWEFIPCANPYISVYFPTETESKLKFIVQGPYRTTPNRGSIPSDDEDNIALAQETMLLLKQAILELRDNKKLNLSFVNILPIDADEITTYDNQSANRLFSPMFTVLKQLFKNEAILPCKNGGYVSAGSSKLARNEKVADLINDELLTRLIADKCQYKWLPTSITETNAKNKKLYYYLVNELGVGVIRPEHLGQYFMLNPAFLPSMSDEWLIELYHIFDTIEAAFTKSNGSLITSNIIKTSTGKFVAPYRKGESRNVIPNVFLPSNSVTRSDINFVDKNIYEKCKHFFDEVLSLTKPNEYEFFVNDIKKRFVDKMDFDEERHISDIKLLLKYIEYPNYRDEVKMIIKDYFSLVCRNSSGRVFVQPYSTKIFYPVSMDGIDIESYYKHISDNYYIDADFYADHGIDLSQMDKFGVTDSILLNLAVISGIYETGRKGKQPSWNTYGEFRWKLNFDKIREVLRYISTHPTARDSILKSTTIWKVLMNNESKLSGTVYIGGDTPNINDVSEIVKILTGESFNGSWNGRWLFTETGDLTSQKVISKYDLSTAYYGKIKEGSVIYELLNFKKNEKDKLDIAAKEYDAIPEDKKNMFFEIELKRRFGISASDLEVTYSPHSSPIQVESEETYEFPTARIKNWELLRKHVAEMLCYANPVKYEARVRSIRVSHPQKEIRVYLQNMYRYAGVYKYACQLCHEPSSDIKATELFLKPEMELDPMHLCLCPNCAAKYDKMRNDASQMSALQNNILSRSESEIIDGEYVAVQFDNDELWFTHTHFAEIQALLKLQAEVEHSKHHAERQPVVVNEDDTDVVNGLTVYKDYEGKRVKFKNGKTAVILKCEGKYFFIQKEGEGKITQYDIATCLSNKAFEIID